VFEPPAAAADEDAAAVKIQAAFRGHKARQQLQQQQQGQPAVGDAVREASAADPMTADAEATAAAAAAAEPAPSWGIGSRVSALKAMLLGSTDVGGSSSSSSMPGQRQGLQPRSVQVAPVTSSPATSGTSGAYGAWPVVHSQLACVALVD
jgi:hypothetical protein